MIKIKICGLSSEEDISYVNELHPDYIGFVFAQKSKRFVSPSRAQALRKLLDPSILAVGVFVDEPLENIQALVQNNTIQIIQLHGKENAAYLASLRALCSCPVIKAFSINNVKDLEQAASFPSDFLLLDNGAGGTGQTFDWSLISKINRPFFLAGGLHAENVSRAIALTHPFAVDTSSGVETECKKDYEKIKAFIKTVRKSSI